MQLQISLSLLLVHAANIYSGIGNVKKDYTLGSTHIVVIGVVDTFGHWMLKLQLKYVGIEKKIYCTVDIFAVHIGSSASILRKMLLVDQDC